MCANNKKNIAPKIRTLIGMTYVSRSHTVVGFKKSVMTDIMQAKKTVFSLNIYHLPNQLVLVASWLAVNSRGFVFFPLMLSRLKTRGKCTQKGLRFFSGIS
jgi:hypothetical protein